MRRYIARTARYPVSTECAPLGRTFGIRARPRSEPPPPASRLRAPSRGDGHAATRRRPLDATCARQEDACFARDEEAARAPEEVRREGLQDEGAQCSDRSAAAGREPTTAEVTMAMPPLRSASSTARPRTAARASAAIHPHPAAKVLALLGEEALLQHADDERGREQVEVVECTRERFSATRSPAKGVVRAARAGLIHGPRTAAMRAGGGAQEARTGPGPGICPRSRSPHGGPVRGSRRERIAPSEICPSAPHMHRDGTGE